MTTLDTQLLTVATGVATFLISNMLRSVGDSARDAVARIFRRHGTPAEAEAHLERLDRDHANLTEQSAQDAIDRWTQRLALFLQEHPEAFTELQQLAQPAKSRPGSVTVTATGNTGPVVQAGHDITGDIRIREGQ